MNIFFILLWLVTLQINILQADLQSSLRNLTCSLQQLVIKFGGSISSTTSCPEQPQSGSIVSSSQSALPSEFELSFTPEQRAQILEIMNKEKLTAQEVIARLQEQSALPESQEEITKPTEQKEVKAEEQLPQKEQVPEQELAPEKIVEQPIIPESKPSTEEKIVEQKKEPEIIPEQVNPLEIAEPNIEVKETVGELPEESAPPPPAPPPLPNPKEKPKVEPKKTGYPQPLSEQEIESLSPSQKKISDQLVLTVLSLVAFYEFSSYNNGEVKLLSQLDELRKNNDFFKRAELLSLIKKIRDNSFGLKAIGLEIASFNQHLEKTMIPAISLQTDRSPIIQFTQALKECLFDQDIPSESLLDIELLIVSLLSCQRVDLPKLTNNQKLQSDNLFLNIIKDFQEFAQQQFAQKKVIGLNRLVKTLNMLRLDTQFLLYKHMLEQADASKKLITDQPILDRLRRPHFAKWTAATKMMFQLYLFDVSLLDDVINKDIMDQVFHEQYDYVRFMKQIKKIPLEEFILNKLSSVKNVQGIKTLLTSISKEYTTNEYNKNLLDELSILLKESSPNIQQIIILLQTLSNHKLPTELTSKIAHYIFQGAEDNAIINIVVTVIKQSSQNPWQYFNNLLLQQFPQKPHPSRVEQILSLLNNIFTTPRDIWHALGIQIQQNLSSEYNIDFAKFALAFDSYGIVLQALQYFIDEFNRQANPLQNYDTLFNGLQQINNGRVDPQEKEVINLQAQQKLEQFKLSKALEIKWPFVLLDRNLSGQKLPSGHYTGQLNNFKSKLTTFLGLLTKRQAPYILQGIIHIMQRYSHAYQQHFSLQQLNEFLQQVGYALAETIKKLPEED